MKSETWLFLGVAAVAAFFIVKSKVNAGEVTERVVERQTAITDRVTERQTEKTLRTETRQENRTERAEDRQAARDDKREDYKDMLNTVLDAIKGKDKTAAASVAKASVPVSAASYVAAKSVTSAKNPVPLISSVVQTAKIAEGAKNLNSSAKKYSFASMVANRPVVKVAAAATKKLKA